MNLTTLKQKASAWWSSRRADVFASLLVLSFLAALIAIGFVVGVKSCARAVAVAQVDPLAALTARVDALERIAPTADADPTAPSPLPARPGAPRAAVRPTQPNTPEAAPGGWGTTDLDREIEDFTRALNQPEQNQ